jgi:dynein heavy chain
MSEDASSGEMRVESHVINPKSILHSQLYGQYDPISQEFTDGVIGTIFRKCVYAKDAKPKRKWVIFDGPVDPIWIEDMNTLLDENKKLCLMNGEVIRMTKTMTIMFETYDLSLASPATISRCGMVYMDTKAAGGWQSLL